MLKSIGGMGFLKVETTSHDTFLSKFSHLVLAEAQFSENFVGLLPQFGRNCWSLKKSASDVNRIADKVDGFTSGIVDGQFHAAGCSLLRSEDVRVILNHGVGDVCL